MSDATDDDGADARRSDAGRFDVKIRRRRQFMVEDEAIVCVEANGHGEALRLAEAHGMYSSVPWRDERRSETSYLAVEALEATRVDPPPVRHTFDHGLVSACGLCGTVQNGIPPEGPWHCRSCRVVNQRQATGPMPEGSQE